MDMNAMINELTQEMSTVPFEDFAEGDSDEDDEKCKEVINLEDVLKRLIHTFVMSRVVGNDRSCTVWGRKVTSSCAAQSPSYYDDVFGGSCTVLTQKFLRAVVPFLVGKNINRASLPNGMIVRLADVTAYRGNYEDNSVPMFGRISHDVLGGKDGNDEEWFVDISGGQFRGQNYPAVCWFYSQSTLHASFQERPLQSFRMLHGNDGVGCLSNLDRCGAYESITKEMEQLLNRVTLVGSCEWCLGKGSRKCSKCQLVSYCGPVCQKLSWKFGGHKSECKANQK